MISIKSINGKDLRVPISEVFSYLEIKGKAQEQFKELVNSCLEELATVITPRACFAEYPYHADGNCLSLGFTETVSCDLSHHLEGCRSIILLAATVGIGADRLVAGYSLTEPSRAVVLQAAGAAAVEAWLDLLCDGFSHDRKLRTRFSCGYGDLDLSLQQDIFTALQCEKHAGITLNRSLLMSPTKSVTAIIGVE